MKGISLTGASGRSCQPEVITGSGHIIYSFLLGGISNDIRLWVLHPQGV